MSEALSPPLIPVAPLDQVLSQQAWVAESLRPYAGRSWRVSLGSISLIQAVIDEEGRLGDHQGIVDCALTLDPSRLFAVLAADPSRRLGAIRIEGDAALAQVLSTLATEWRPDLEAWLAERIGPELARGVQVRGSVIAQQLADGFLRSAENVAEFLVHEERVLVAPIEIQHWASGVRLLRDDVARLQKRIDRLAAPSSGER